MNANAIVTTKVLDGSKFSDRDITQDLVKSAMEYVKNYMGSFAFMVELRTKLTQYGTLSTAQVRGALNCMLAEMRRTVQAVAPEKLNITPAPAVVAPAFKLTSKPAQLGLDFFVSKPAQLGFDFFVSAPVATKVAPVVQASVAWDLEEEFTATQMATPALKPWELPLVSGWDKSGWDAGAAAYLLAPGTYTVSQHGEHRTFKISVKYQTIKAAGVKKRLPTPVMYVGLLTGPDNGSNYTYVGRIEAGIFSAAKGYTAQSSFVAWLVGLVEKHENLTIQESCTCYMCGRKLTTPTSIARRKGAVCAAK